MPFSPDFTALLHYCIHTILTWGDHGRPLWPTPASSIYRAFLTGDTEGARVAVLVWDVSVHGWGTMFQASASEQGKLLIGTSSAADSAAMTNKQVQLFSLTLCKDGP